MKSLTLTLPLLVLAVPAAAQEPIPWANKFFTGPTSTPPPVILHDFGTLPKGTVKTYRFKMTNIYAVPMQVQEPKPSCGCVSVVEYTGQMGPREAGHIDIKLDTRRVDGPKVIKLPVTFRGQDPTTKEPFFSTADLEIRAISRAEIAVEPGAFGFGRVPAGRKASQSVVVTYAGTQPNWKITEYGVRKELFDIAFEQIPVRGTKAYRVTLTLKETAPAGALTEHVELRTNEPGNQGALTLAVTGFVQPPLSIVGTDHVKFPGVDVGQKTQQNVTIQAESAFKVTAVEGQGDGVSVMVLPLQPKKAQVITITFAPEKAGPVKKVLTVKTDTGESVALTVEGVGKVP